MIDRVMKNEKIELVLESRVTEIGGNGFVEEITVQTNENQPRKLDVRGVFVAIGHIPNSKFISSLVETDEHGYIKTNGKMETSLPGIWAAGDVQDPHYRQAITAAGSGCIAALEVERWLN